MEKHFRIILGFKSHVLKLERSRHYDKIVILGSTSQNSDFDLKGHCL